MRTLKIAVIRLGSLLALVLSIQQTDAQNRHFNHTAQFAGETDLAGHLSPHWKWESNIQYTAQSAYEDIDLARYASQTGFRSWLHYYPLRTLKLSVFGGVWYNLPIEDNVSQREYPEYRVALQAQHFWSKGRGTLSNRFRTELRDIRDKAGEFEKVFRARYMLKYQRLLTHSAYDAKSCYGIVSDEVFYNGGSAVTGYKHFDQNRIFGGLGYNVTNDIAIEIGFCDQLAYHSHDLNFDNNESVQVSLIFDNLDL